ncbi:MAG: CDP-alcohol phosphatidyltransferase family protein [Spirochaetia bacterium]|nr:CDP-alcohol phosphatidyltransferase family protein [Spirochaetia bacterium]
MTLRELFSHRVFTIPNILSFSRIVLLIPVWFLIWTEQYINQYSFETISIIIMMVATDYFDGYLARKLGQQTPLGQYLDPIADKITILGGMTLLYLKRGYPFWLFMYIVLREIYGAFFGYFLLTRRNILGKPNYWGKAGVFFISVSGVCYLLDIHDKWISDIPVMIALTGGLIAYSTRYIHTVFSGGK